MSTGLIAIAVIFVSVILWINVSGTVGLLFFVAGIVAVAIYRGKYQYSDLAEEIRNIQPATGYSDIHDLRHIKCDISEQEYFDIEAIREFNYVHIMARLYPESVSGRTVKKYFVFALSQDDDDPHEKDAVSVKLNDYVVGYLSNEDAQAYRKWAEEHALPKIATCRGLVSAREKKYGIWLNLPAFR